MRTLAALFAVAAAALTFASPGIASTGFGVADDSPKYAPDGGAAFFAEMQGAGLSELRITVTWDSARPGEIFEKAYLDRMLPQAAERGVRVIFAVYPTKARAFDSPAQIAQFASFLQKLAHAYPQIDRYIIGNEVNLSRFFQPQFTASCKGFAGGTYMAVLARAYDALKGVDPAIRVITSVSPRGNDSCSAPSNVSTSPCRFIHDMGAAYKGMARARPAFDEWGSHVYPNEATDPLMKGYPWPNIGISNLNRLKQCVWDAFEGTAQPTFERAFHPGGSLAALHPTPLNLAEVGWQVGIVPDAQDAYFGSENVKTTDEQTQAKIYGELVRYVVCDSAVTTVLFFGLDDEPDLGRFQAGLIRADGTHRPSYDTVKDAIGETDGECAAKERDWQPTESVVDAQADFGKALGVKPPKQKYWGFQASADEDSLYTAGIFRVGSGALSAALQARIGRSLSSAAAPAKPVLSASGKIKAYWSPIVRFPARKLRPGQYVYAIRIRAALNPERERLIVSRAFRVGRAAG